MSAFIPIADLMNHKNGYSTLGFDAAEQVVTSFKHIAEVDYAPGDELFASYSNGNACNQHLLYVRCAVRRGAICSRPASLTPPGTTMASHWLTQQQTVWLSP